MVAGAINSFRVAKTINSNTHALNTFEVIGGSALVSGALVLGGSGLCTFASWLYSKFSH